MLDSKETTMGTEQIIEMALQLKPAERLQVIDRLHESLDQPDPEIDRLWHAEAVRRLEAHRSGKENGIRMEEVFRKR